MANDPVATWTNSDVDTVHRYIQRSLATERVRSCPAGMAINIHAVTPEEEMVQLYSRTSHHDNMPIYNLTSIIQIQQRKVKKYFLRQKKKKKKKKKKITSL